MMVLFNRGDVKKSKSLEVPARPRSTIVHIFDVIMFLPIVLDILQQSSVCGLPNNSDP